VQRFHVFDSFLLTEGKTAQPTLKVYVTADSNIARGKPKYYSAKCVRRTLAGRTQTVTQMATAQWPVHPS
jgi:hypothetical protein